MPKKRPGNRPIKLIVCVADTHFGSTVALLPPGFTTLEGNEIQQNAIQEWLWQCWQRANQFIADVAGDDPYALVLNGDLIEGIHHGTKQVWSPEVADHARCAVETLRPLAEKAAKTFAIYGTEIHVGNSEVSIADSLQAEVNPETGKKAFERLVVDVNGVRHVFRHHIGSTIRRGLAGTQLSVNLAEEQLEAINNGEEIPRVVCVAHRHKYGTYKDDNGMCIVSPPWQALTRFGHKVVSQARTKPGVYLIDHRYTAYGALPEVHTQIYETPHPKAFRLGN